jgi:hypothetical protein
VNYAQTVPPFSSRIVGEVVQGVGERAHQGRASDGALPLAADPAEDDLVGIVDENGEDYLYHKSYFVLVDFPPAV